VILALDFESGGTDPNRHAPVQLGVAVMENGEVLHSAEWLIGPTFHWKTGKIERSYEVAALEVSGIGWKAIKSAPHPKQIVRELREWVDSVGAAELPIVAFNAPFDMAFYSTLLFLASDWHPTTRGVRVRPASPLMGGWHCAMLRFHEQFGDRYDDVKLDTAAGHFGLSRESASHGALEDAILAGRIYHALTREAVTV
jgi:DNA polymerase III epsilon subunit-like protein